MKQVLRLPMQFFAEGDGTDQDGKNGNASGAGTPPPAGGTSGAGQSNPDQAVYTKKQVDALLEQARAAMEQDYKNQQSQAERLAAMGNEERFKLELQQMNEKMESAVAQLNAYKLKDEAVKLAGEEGLPLCFLQHFDFGSLTAEQVSTAVKEMAAEYKKEITRQISESLKQDPPQGGIPNGGEDAGVREAAALAKQYSERFAAQ